MCFKWSNYFLADLLEWIHLPFQVILLDSVLIEGPSVVVYNWCFYACVSVVNVSHEC